MDAGTERSACLTWSVGEIRVTRVEEFLTPVTRESLIPDLTDDEIAACRDWCDPYVTGSNLLLLSFHAFVVECGDMTIVVDTCLGVDPPRDAPGDPTFPDRLGAVMDGGLSGVDIVLCTHLHFDHVGWNMRVVDGRQVPTFPSARYLFGRRELEHLDADGDSHAVREPSVLPLLDAGLVDIIDDTATDGRVLAQNGSGAVRTLATPGHTPGHVSVLIESGGSSALITGDAAHSPLQFAFPDRATTTFDWNPEMSTDTRRRLVETYAESDTLMLGTHFAPPTAGHIRRTGDDRVDFIGVDADRDGPRTRRSATGP